MLLLIERRCGVVVVLFKPRGLIPDDFIRAPCLARVAKQQVVLELVHRVIAYPERIYDYAIFQKFDKVKTSERGCILVLQAALYCKVFSLDNIGEIGNLVGG